MIQRCVLSTLFPSLYLTHSFFAIDLGSILTYMCTKWYIVSQLTCIYCHVCLPLRHYSVSLQCTPISLINLQDLCISFCSCFLALIFILHFLFLFVFISVLTLKYILHILVDLFLIFYFLVTATWLLHSSTVISCHVTVCKSTFYYILSQPVVQAC